VFKFYSWFPIGAGGCSVSTLIYMQIKPPNPSLMQAKGIGDGDDDD
jgi:hypothetical protein